MGSTDEFVTLALPQSALPTLTRLPSRLLDRLHELLELNADGALSPLEREEVETLVAMSGFAQAMALAVQAMKLEE